MCKECGAEGLLNYRCLSKRKLTLATMVSRQRGIIPPTSGVQHSEYMSQVLIERKLQGSGRVYICKDEIWWINERNHEGFKVNYKYIGIISTQKKNTTYFEYPLLGTPKCDPHLFLLIDDKPEWNEYDDDDYDDCGKLEEIHFFPANEKSSLQPIYDAIKERLDKLDSND